jgi:hypothetical protein
MSAVVDIISRLATKGYSVDAIKRIIGREATMTDIRDVISGMRNAARLKAEKEAAAREVAMAAAIKRRQAISRYRIITVRGVDRPMAQIIEETARLHGLTSRDLVSQSRRKELVRARQEAMYRCASETENSYPRIARAMKRDHTTVLHGVQKHAERNGLPLPRGMQLEGRA